MKILIAEDDAQARRLVCSVLSHMGHEVIPAEDGKSALSLFEHHGREIDLVITDYEMPSLNGEQVAVLIKMRNPRAKVFLHCSGREESVDSGIFDRYVPKPFIRSEWDEIFKDLC